MGTFLAVLASVTGFLVLCSVPALVVAQRRNRFDVSRRFVRSAVAIGVFFGLSAAASDRLVGQCTGSGSITCLDVGYAGLLVVVTAIYLIVALTTAIVMSRR